MALTVALLLSPGAARSQEQPPTPMPGERVGGDCACVIEPKILPDRPASKAEQEIRELKRQIRALKREIRALKREIRRLRRR